MTPDDELLALAEKAAELKGPWLDMHALARFHTDAADLVMACSPERIIALVRRCQEAERAIELLNADAESATVACEALSARLAEIVSAATPFATGRDGQTAADVIALRAALSALRDAPRVWKETHAV